jgi:hypothetical protein
MLIVDIAQEIYIEAGEPTSTSVPAIAYWIRGKVGTINSLLCENFCISSDTFEIIDCCGVIGLNVAAVLKQMYRLYDLQVQVNNNMNAMAQDQISSVEDSFGGGKFTRYNKNEISKTLISMRKDEIEILNKLVAAYKINKAVPIQVAGDDTIPAMWGEHLVSLRNV